MRKVRTKPADERPVLVTTAHRGVFFGYATATDGSGTSGAGSSHLHTVDPPSTTSGAASNTDNKPAYYGCVPLLRL